jgi:CheY-like chemotaxis protein
MSCDRSSPVSDGQHAVALTREHRPDIALIDIQMPVLDGLKATFGLDE